VGRRRFGANGELGMRSYAATRRRTRTLFVIQSIPFNVKPAEVIRAAKELELEGVIAKRNGSIDDPLRPRLRYRFLRPSTHRLTATHIP
jgi:hypothetical protein